MDNVGFTITIPSKLKAYKNLLLQIGIPSDNTCGNISDKRNFSFLCCFVVSFFVSKLVRLFIFREIIFPSTETC